MPWRIPTVDDATRSETRMRTGWSVTLQCAGQCFFSSSLSSSIFGAVASTEGEAENSPQKSIFNVFAPGHSSNGGAGPSEHVLSYYYLHNPTTFTCESGRPFVPEQPFSCQSELRISEERLLSAALEEQNKIPGNETVELGEMWLIKFRKMPFKIVAYLDQNLALTLRKWEN